MLVSEHIDLQPYNTFGVPAQARYFAHITQEDQLEEVLRDPKWEAITKLALGGGSNVLLTRDFDGMLSKWTCPESS